MVAVMMHPTSERRATDWSAELKQEDKSEYGGKEDHYDAISRNMSAQALPVPKACSYCLDCSEDWCILIGSKQIIQRHLWNRAFRTSINFCSSGGNLMGYM